MRVHFETKFDSIRRENDMYLSQVRTRRDKCAQRICDLVDSHDALSHDLGVIYADIATYESQLLLLNERLKSLISEFNEHSSQFSERNRLAAEWQRTLGIEEVYLEKQKADLRDEIRDLRGFIKMKSKLASIPGASGSTILATNPRPRRRK